MKKKAFTLVEVIAAIGILSITILAISTAFITGIHTLQKGGTKLKTMQYAEGITEGFQGGGITLLQNKCNSLTGSFSYSTFLYFNDDFTNFKALNDNTSYDSFSDWLNSTVKLQGTVSMDDYNSANIDNNIFNKCVSSINNISNNSYGCYIMIENSNSSSAIYVKVRLWNVKYLDSESIREFYIGR